MTERAVGDLPAAVERADEIFRGYLNVVEEDLVEVQIIAVIDRSEGATHQPRSIAAE